MLAKTIAMGKNKTTFISYLGPCASFLCLIHCFGFAFASAIAPGFLKLLPHSEYLEALVIVISTLFGHLSFKILSASRVLKLFFYFFCLTGSFSLMFGHHFFFQSSLVLMALLQLSLSIYRHFIAEKSAPACCLKENE